MIPRGGRFHVDGAVHAGALERWQLTAHTEVADLGNNRFLFRGGDPTTDCNTIVLQDLEHFRRLLTAFERRVVKELEQGGRN